MQGFDTNYQYAWLKVAKRGVAGWTTEFIDEQFRNNSANNGQFAGRSRGKLAVGDIAAMGSGGYGTNSSLIVARWFGTGFAYRGYLDKVSGTGIHLNAGNLDIAANGTVHGCGSDYNPNTGTPGTLLYVTGTWDGGFTSKVIDGASKVGTPCKIVLDAAGIAHIVYYDSGNLVMRYRNVVNGVASAGDVPDASFGSGGVLDLVIAADGALWAVYGGGSLRVATSKNAGPWSAEILGTDPTDAVAIVALPNGSLTVFYQTTGGIKSRTRVGAVWNAEAVIGTPQIAPQRLAATLDAQNNIHLAAVYQDQFLWHLTNKFGGWSQVSTSMQLGSQSASLDILTGIDGRVLVPGTDAVPSGKMDAEVSFTYQNLVDDNCDGK